MILMRRESIKKLELHNAYSTRLSPYTAAKKNDSFQMHSSRIAIMCHIIQMCNDLKFERLTKRSCVS